jgi:hypothetical protein
MFSISMFNLPNLTIIRIKQMNEGRSDNDTSTKVSREEVDNQRDFEPSHAFSENRKEGDGGGEL